MFEFLVSSPSGREALATTPLKVAALLSLFLLPAPAASAQPSTRITREDAIRLAIAHNHALQAERATISQRKSDEVTANLRPNPVLGADAQFVPIFTPHMFTTDTLDNVQQFDVGLSYLFERGGKRQHRLKAARDQTELARLQVADNERQLRFQVAAQFIAALRAESALDLARQNLSGYQKAVGIAERRYHDGAISRRDLLKIQVERLQFQTDLDAARLARRQALAGLRQLLGFESVPADFDVSGTLAYRPFSSRIEDLLAQAKQQRPDLRAAQQAVEAAKSQYELAKANAKQDVTGTVNYTHVSGFSSASFFVSVPLPLFDRNQGAIDAAGYAVTQAKEEAAETAQQVETDVLSAYDAVVLSGKLLETYNSGYLGEAAESRKISQYAYQRGAAGILDYLDAERSLRDTELSYRTELAAYLQALAQLEEAVGTRNLR